MEKVARLKGSPSRHIAVGAMLAVFIFQFIAAQHFHAGLIHIENCSECLLGNDDPAVTPASLSFPKTEFLSDCCAFPPTPGIVTFVAFDRLSRAPPLF